MEAIGTERSGKAGETYLRLRLRDRWRGKNQGFCLNKLGG